MTLQEKLNAFYRLELPGQPKFMHMGTMGLMRNLEVRVDELEQDKTMFQWSEVALLAEKSKLEKVLNEYQITVKRMIDEANVSQSLVSELQIKCLELMKSEAALYEKINNV